MSCDRVSVISLVMLSAFLLLMIFVMSLLYSIAIATMTSTSSVPVVYGSYGVEPGVIGTILYPNKPPIEITGGIAQATRVCDSTPECASFYYDSGMMVLMTDDNARTSGQTGAVYRRQVPLKTLLRP